MLTGLRRRGSIGDGESARARPTPPLARRYAGRAMPGCQSSWLWVAPRLGRGEQGQGRLANPQPPASLHQVQHRLRGAPEARWRDFGARRAGSSRRGRLPYSRRALRAAISRLAVLVVARVGSYRSAFEGEQAVRQPAPRRAVAMRRRPLWGHAARNRGPRWSRCNSRRRSPGRASCVACR